MSCSYCHSDQKVVGRGLCRKCYSRWHKTGSIDYKKWYKPKKLCSIEGCGKEHQAKGLCGQHYVSTLRYGDIISPIGYGERSNHQLYQSWKHQEKTILGREDRWNDFWIFVDDVGNKPYEKCRLVRLDKTKSWGPKNFQWVETKNSSEDKNLWMREYRKNNLGKFKEIELKKRFGITLDEYLRMYRNQDRRCAICGKLGVPISEKFDVAKTLVVDHCHASHKIRQLLCGKCNRGLGCFSDDVQTLKNAVQYLEHHQSPSFTDAQVNARAETCHV